MNSAEVSWLGGTPDQDVDEYIVFIGTRTASRQEMQRAKKTDPFPKTVIILGVLGRILCVESTITSQVNGRKGPRQKLLSHFILSSY